MLPRVSELTVEEWQQCFEDSNFEDLADEIFARVKSLEKNNPVVAFHVIDLIRSIDENNQEFVLGYIKGFVDAIALLEAQAAVDEIAPN